MLVTYFIILFLISVTDADNKNICWHSTIFSNCLGSVYRDLPMVVFYNLQYVGIDKCENYIITKKFNKLFGLKEDKMSKVCDRPKAVVFVVV